MAADARAAVRRLPGVRTVTIKLQDHYTGDEINRALTRGDGFSGAFPGETEDDDLSALGELFQRKTLIARHSKLCEALLAVGAGPDQIVGCALRISTTVESCGGVWSCASSRELPFDPGAPAFVSPNEEPLAAGALERWLRRMARLIRASLETNGGICRSLLQFRHDLASDPS